MVALGEVLHLGRILLAPLRSPMRLQCPRSPGVPHQSSRPGLRAGGADGLVRYASICAAESRSRTWVYKGAISRGQQLLEREAELEALEAAISAGSGRVLILEGAAGVGKSALLTVARGMAAERGHQVMHARGSELMRGVPFGVAVELFAEALRAATPAQRDEELFSGAGGLAASLFSPATAYRPATARDPSLPMVHGLYWLLVNLSERAPCLVVVDDVHWADEPSLCFLVYLVERVEGLPVTVLVALRPEDAAIAGRPM